MVDDDETEGLVEQDTSSEDIHSSQGHESDEESVSTNEQEGHTSSGNGSEGHSEQDSPIPRRSNRQTRPPTWHDDYVMEMNCTKPPWKMKVDYLHELLVCNQCKGYESQVISAILNILKQ